MKRKPIILLTIPLALIYLSLVTVSYIGYTHIFQDVDNATEILHCDEYAQSLIDEGWQIVENNDTYITLRDPDNPDRFTTILWALDTSTTYSSTSDGHIRGEGSTYASARDDTSGTIDDTSEYLVVGQYRSGNTYQVYRAFLFFDTSAIDDNAVFSSGTLSFCPHSDLSDVDFDITIQSGMPTYPHDPLEVGDVDRTHYSGDGGSWNTSNYVDTVNYVDITLNTTSLNWVNLTGTTKYCLRSSRDINNIAPGDGVNERFGIRTTEENSINKDPKLVLTYTVNNPPSTPTINSPSDGSTTDDTTPDLKVNVSDPDGDSITKYDILVDNNSDFSSPEINLTDQSCNVASGGVLTHTCTTLSASQTYYWKIRVKDTYHWSEWTDGTWDFYINDAPSTPTLNSPSDGSTTYDTTPDLVVNVSDPDSDNITLYDILVDNNSDFSSPEINLTDQSCNVASGSTLTHTCTTLSTGQTYYWKIRVRDSSLWSEWTDGTWDFYIEENYAPSVDITDPTTTQSGNVTITYTLTDANSDTCSITVQFSEDGGSSFSSATEGTGGDGTSGLSSSPTGTEHTFVWDTNTDIGIDDQSDIQIKITPHDGLVSGTADTTSNFRVDNNNDPTLTYTGESNYTTSYVYPTSAYENDIYTFRVCYTDLDNQAPTEIQVWIDNDQDGEYSLEEKYDMADVDGSDSDYTDGKLYYKSIAMDTTGNIKFKIYAIDGITGVYTTETTVEVLTRESNVPSGGGTTHSSSQYTVPPPTTLPSTISAPSKKIPLKISPLSDKFYLFGGAFVVFLMLVVVIVKRM